MQQLDVCRKESGKIWTRKLIPTNDGLLMTVMHSVSGSLPLGSRNVRFLHVAFDAPGDRFIAGDCQGNIYLFNIHGNKFTLVQKTGSPCSALAFALHRRSEFLVAMADRSLKCFDTETKELVAMMQGHESTIHSISMHASGRYAMTTCTKMAQLWDLDSFQRKRKLTVKEEVPIVKVFFLPMSNTVMMCFKDDSIFAWDSETLQSLYHLHIPVPGEKSPGFKTFAASRDSRVLVAGGRSRFVHVWSLESKQLLRVVELPKKVTSVSQLEFLPDSFDAGSNQILGALCQDGILRFVNLGTFVQLFDVGRLDDRINSFVVSSSGRHIVAVMDSGNVNIYSAQALVSALNKPPPPLVKVLKSDRASGLATANDHVTSSAEHRVETKSSEAHSIRSGSNCRNVSQTTELSGSRLMSILKGYGEYPAKYRMFIWRTILQLPENHLAYAALMEKGTHPAFERLHEKYPIKSPKLQRVLQRVLSALAHWSPIFGETDFLPMMAFPFVKLFQNNQLVCFEIIATVLTSWCQHWFEYFPNPPINVLGMVENVLAYHDKELLQHFISHGITSQTYAWFVLETLFSEVLTRDEWLRLMDNVFSNHPAFLLMLVVSYCVIGRAALLRCSERNDFEYYFHHRNAMSVKQLITEAYHLMDSTPLDVHPQNMLEDFVSLTKGQYPIFNKYPKFIVDYQVQERERIRKEEQEYLRQQSLATDLRVEIQKRQQEEEGWYRQQQLLVDAEQARRNIIAEEEQKLTDQRTKLLAMTRESRMKELQLLDAARRKFMTFTQQQKEAELSRLDDEIRRKANLREAETRVAIEEVEIKNMELQLQKKLFEQELQRDHADLSRRHAENSDARLKQRQKTIGAVRNSSSADVGSNRDQQTRIALQRGLAHSEQLYSDAEFRARADEMHQAEELLTRKAAAKVSELEATNKQLEEEIHQAMRNLDFRKNAEARVADEDLLEKRCGQTTSESLTSTSGVRTDERSSVDTDSVISLLDRSREALDASERDLLAEVRQLRHRLAHEGRTRKPVPS